MTKFQLHILDRDLKSEDTDDLIGSSTANVEWLESTKAEMRQSLSNFLSFDIYIGRSRNAGHKAFWHPNYNFPAFADEILTAANAFRATEYIEVIDELKAVMASDLVQNSSSDYYDLDELKELGLDKVFEDFNDRSFNIRLSRDEFEKRISDYSKETKSWVLDRYKSDGKEEPYCGLAAAWLMNSFDLVTHSEEAWRDKLSLRPLHGQAERPKRTMLSHLLSKFRRQ